MSFDIIIIVVVLTLTCVALKSCTSTYRDATCVCIFVTVIHAGCLFTYSMANSPLENLVVKTLNRSSVCPFNQQAFIILQDCTNTT